jgi:hypothetical protein
MAGAAGTLDPRRRGAWWTWLSILAGWVFTSAVVAALTGILKRD